MSLVETDLIGSNSDHPRLRDLSTSRDLSSPAPIASAEEEPSASLPLPARLILGLFKLGALALLVYLTYFFARTFALGTPTTAPSLEAQKALAKKEELLAQGKKLLSTYAWVNPALKSSVRIP